MHSTVVKTGGKGGTGEIEMTLRDSSSMSSTLYVLDSIYFYLVRIYIVYMVNVAPSIFSIVCRVNLELFIQLMHFPAHSS